MAEIVWAVVSGAVGEHLTITKPVSFGFKNPEAGLLTVMLK
jgi:hypothetical protein